MYPVLRGTSATLEKKNLRWAVVKGNVVQRGRSGERSTRIFQVNCERQRFVDFVAPVDVPLHREKRRTKPNDEEGRRSV